MITTPRTKVKIGSGVTVRSGKETRTGHVIQDHEGDFVIQDAVTREHITIQYEDVEIADITEVDAPWLGNKDPRRIKPMAITINTTEEV